MILISSFVIFNRVENHYMKNQAALREMEAYISNFPDNLLEALDIGKNAVRDLRVQPVEKVVMCGLGGSGIGARFVTDLAWETSKIPVVLINDYRIPKWVDSRTLFVATSYSGNTEETLNALSEAVFADANIVCITAGGKLRQLAREKGFGLFEIPDGQPPRTSFGYNSVQQLFVFNAYGLTGFEHIDGIQEAAALLKEQSGFIRAEAAAIANKIQHAIPVIYADVHSEGIAVRLRQQINENAKKLCWHHVLPEMNHNELVGWAGGNSDFAALIIHTPDDYPATSTRMELTAEIIGRYTENVIELRPKGSSRISRAYYLIHLCDWISFYLAEESGADPVEIDIIDYLKGELGKR